MPTTTTSFGVVAWRAWKRSATVSLWTPGRRCVSWPTTPMTAASKPATSTATTCGPCARAESSSRFSRAATVLLARARDVAVAGAHEDRALAAQVADGHRAVGHGRARPGARVGRDPLRPADGRDAVAPVRAEAPALVRAPQLAPRRLGLRRRGRGPGGGARPARRAGEGRTAKVDVGGTAAGGGLPHAEDAAVEPGRLGLAVGKRGRQRDLAAARVDDGARRH